MKPPFNIYGGKAYYHNWIISQFPEHNIYVEPFGGAANIILNKAPSTVEVFNDLDSYIYNIFRVLRDPILSENLLHKLRLTPYNRETFNEALSINTKDPVLKAWKFFVVANQSYSGLGMEQGTGASWAVCLRKRRNMADSVSKYLSKVENLPNIIDRFGSVVVENLPYQGVFEKYDDKAAFFYLDPPYIPESRKTKKVYRHDMTEKDHENLLGRIGNLKGKVMISGYPGELYNNVLRSWKSEKLYTNTKANHAGQSQRTEVIWMNY